MNYRVDKIEPLSCNNINQQRKLPTKSEQPTNRKMEPLYVLKLEYRSLLAPQIDMLFRKLNNRYQYPTMRRAVSVKSDCIDFEWLSPFVSLRQYTITWRKVIETNQAQSHGSEVCKCIAGLPYQHDVQRSWTNDIDVLQWRRALIARRSNCLFYTG